MNTSITSSLGLLLCIEQKVMGRRRTSYVSKIKFNLMFLYLPFFYILYKKKEQLTQGFNYLYSLCADVNKYVFLYSLPVSIFRPITLLLDFKPIARCASP